MTSIGIGVWRTKSGWRVYLGREQYSEHDGALDAWANAEQLCTAAKRSGEEAYIVDLSHLVMSDDPPD